MTSTDPYGWRVSWWLWGNPREYDHYGQGERALTDFLRYLQSHFGDDLRYYEIACLDD